MAPDTRFYRYLALISHVALLSWVILWHFLLAPDAGYSVIFILLIYVVPLVLPLKGVIQGKPYTHAWANFIIMFYLIHGFTIAYASEAERWYAIIEITLSTTMFVGCSIFARKRGRELGQGLKKMKVEMQEERQRFQRSK